MTSKFSALRKPQQIESFYTSFDQINGDHPLKKVIPFGHVSYRVRELENSKVLYFNFPLAKEMGLISLDHPNQMNPLLEEKLLSTFALQIINEFDEISNKNLNSSRIKPHRYMATRYLQLQHSSRTGKTSGDGRGIWNGVVTFQGTTWDVSSRGTGVTCLAPGSAVAKKPLQTGDSKFSYGCGLAEMDELLGAAVLAEVIHLQGVPTERVLCVIDTGNGYGIGVRAAQNLLRPAHLFLYHKQGRWAELRALTDYILSRQISNGKWSFRKGSYSKMLSQICDEFADFIAKLDVDYIFSWLDWDGDNVLIDAGIIDYGSVRQFGLRHDHYRYDDVERFSTNLNEQKRKARQILQVFAQMTDYLRMKKKKSLDEFAEHPVLLRFDRQYEKARQNRILYRIGFDQNQRRRLLKWHSELFKAFEKEFNFFERQKISVSPIRVADGINCLPSYNVRRFLAHYPQWLSQNRETSEEETFKLLASSFNPLRRPKGTSLLRRLKRFRKLYQALLLAADVNMPDFIERARILNSDQRITGNALIEIIDEILQASKRNLPPGQIQKLLDKMILMNTNYPEVDTGPAYQNFEEPAVQHDLFQKILKILKENSETI